MKKFRAIMSVFLAVALVLSAVPAFPVAAEADENLPKATSVTIENVEIYECTCGDYYEGNYIYQWVNPEFTVTLEDGSELKSNEDGFVDVGTGTYGYSVSFETQSQYETPWVAGQTYTVIGSIFGASSTFTIKIKESPVKTLQIQNLEIVENTNGYSTDSGYIYNLYPEFTATLKDGTTVTGSGGRIQIDGKYYSISIDNSLQFSNHFKVGNTYEVEGQLFGVKGNFKVSILKSPYKSLEINNIEIIENTKGFSSNGAYIYNTFRPDFTLTLNSGDKISSENGWLNYNGYSYCLEYTTEDQQKNPWKAGETHTVTAGVFGLTATCNVKIVENPIQSINIESTKIFENTNGWYENGSYYYSNFYPKVTATLKNGNTVTGYGGITLNNQEYSLELDFSSQDVTPWEAGHTYAVNGSILGVTGTFYITIEETPIASLKVENIEIMEATHGYWSGSTYIYNDFVSEADVTATLKNGKTVTGVGGITYGDSFVSIQSSTGAQQYENSWSAGNSYTVTATILGYSTTFQVTIKESSVESIEIEDVKVIAGVENSGLYPRFTANLKGGKKSSGIGYAAVDGTYSELDIFYPENLSSWKAGETHTVTANFMGKTGTFKVTVVENPIEKLEVCDLTYLEGTGGYLNTESKPYYFYSMEDIEHSKFNVSLKGGQKLSSVYYSEVVTRPDYGMGGGYPGIFLDGVYYCGLNIKNYKQSAENPWHVGKYNATAEFLGVSADFNVFIKENPIQSVEIEDLTLYEGIDYFADDYYTSIEPNYTVTFKDGTAKKIKGSSAFLLNNSTVILENDYDQSENRLQVGQKYKLTGYVASATDTFELTVAKNPIKSIELVKQPTKTVYSFNEHFNLKGATLRVNYNDGSFEDINILKDETGYDYTYKLSKIQKTFTLDFESYLATAAAEEKIEISIFNNSISTECEIQVQESAWQKLEIKTGKNKSLVLTASKADGTIFEMQAVSFSTRSGDEGYFGGLLFTDKGTLRAKMYYSEAGCSIEIEGLKSNTLTNCGFVDYYLKEAMDYTFSNTIINAFSQIAPFRFNGAITASNIDSLIGIACCEFDKSIGVTWSGKEITAAFLKTFAVSSVDLTLSKNYDAKTDTYTYNADTASNVSSIFNSYVCGSLQYNGSFWQLTVLKTDGSTVLINMDDNFKIISINAAGNALENFAASDTAGDADGDGYFTIKDSVLVAQYLAGYDVSANVVGFDYNQDGLVNLKDSYLMFKTCLN